MALILSRPHTRLVVDATEPGAVMTGAELFHGTTSVGRIMGDPKVLEALALACDSQSTVADVAAGLTFEANQVRANGHDKEADMVDHVASFVAGAIDSCGPAEVIARVCNYLVGEDEHRCGSENARQCGRCMSWYCVVHWSGDEHLCTPAARQRAKVAA